MLVVAPSCIFGNFRLSTMSESRQQPTIRTFPFFLVLARFLIVNLDAVYIRCFLYPIQKGGSFSFRRSRGTLHDRSYLSKHTTKRCNVWNGAVDGKATLVTKA
ncbi:UNVERIFIED_CONTAM: hypothetical protein ABID98_005112 [Brevibacillus sp. OAP136]